MNTIGKMLSVLALAGGLVLLSWFGAEAQVVADDLQCTGCVDTIDIKTQAVTNRKIRDGAVNTRKLALSAVNTGRIGTSAVTTPKIADGAVSASKLASDAVFGRIFVVRNDPLDTVGNCDELQATLAGITDNDANNRYMIWLEPGIYDCGTTPVWMKPFVDIQGSGQETTIIRGMQENSPGVLFLADNSELRFLTVENTLDSSLWVSRAIRAQGTSGRMTHVRAISLGQRGQALVVLLSEEATVRDSVLIGSTSLAVVGTGNIVSTQLNGRVISAGIFRCVGAYDGNFAALNAICQ